MGARQHRTDGLEPPRSGAAYSLTAHLRADADVAAVPVSSSPLASRRWARALLLWLPAAVWLIGTPLIVLHYVGQSLTFFGEQLSAQGVEAARVTLVWAAVCCAGAPLAGLAVASLARSSRAVALYSIAVVIGCVPGLSWAVLDDHRNPISTERVTTCLEHSGGDTRCPGG